MKYKYIPDNYDKVKISEYNLEDDEFVELQIKYRQAIEKILKRIIDFEEIDRKLEEKIDIPKVEDSEYNFYHKYSTLPSNYLFLRNNIHIERLTLDEIEYLKSCEILDIDFLTKTLSRVLFELGDRTYYGIPCDKTEGPSKSIIFEFGYNQTKCSSIEQLKNINIAFEKVSNYINNEVIKKIKLPSYMIKYNSIIDEYNLNNNPVIR